LVAVRVGKERLDAGGGVEGAAVRAGQPERTASHSCVLVSVTRVVRGRHLSVSRSCKRERADRE